MKFFNLVMLAFFVSWLQVFAMHIVPAATFVPWLAGATVVYIALRRNLDESMVFAVATALLSWMITISDLGLMVVWYLGAAVLGWLLRIFVFRPLSSNLAWIFAVMIVLLGQTAYLVFKKQLSSPAELTEIILSYGLIVIVYYGAKSISQSRRYNYGNRL